ncbi:MAG TPA: hypothetical protein VN133_14655 [Humibacter sp.]|nr:hypothetical protein [Humibacter sp.]
MIVAIAFAWSGAVVAISFLETPLKFRAPGITLKLGLGIGRIVFRAMNVLEGVLAAGLVIAAILGLADGSTSGPSEVSVAGAVAVLTLLAQVALVRPALARRTAAVLADRAEGGSRVHLAYVALELVKLASLIVAGVAALVALA